MAGDRGELCPVRVNRLWLPLWIVAVVLFLRFTTTAHFSQLPAACIALGLDCPRDAPAPIRGHYAAEYAPVAQALQQLVQKGYTLGASVAVYLEGKPVVSIAAGHGRFLLFRAGQRHHLQCCGLALQSSRDRRVLSFGTADDSGRRFFGASTPVIVPTPKCKDRATE